MDIIISCGVGVFVAGSVIIYNSYTKKVLTEEEFDKINNNDSVSDNDNNNYSSSGDGVTTEKVLEQLDEDVFLKKTNKLRETFGVTEADVRKAIKATRNDLLLKQQQKQGSNNDNDNVNNNENYIDLDPISWVKIFDWIIGFTLFLLLCYVMNRSTGGDAARVLAGIFPREFEFLGIKEYVERGGHRHTTSTSTSTSSSEEL